MPICSVSAGRVRAPVAAQKEHSVPVRPAWTLRSISESLPAPGVAVRYTGVIRDAMGWAGVRLPDGSGIAGASGFGPCAAVAMSGRLVR
jgi:hypothetical protein